MIVVSLCFFAFGLSLAICEFATCLPVLGYLLHMWLDYYLLLSTFTLMVSYIMLFMTHSIALYWIYVMMARVYAGSFLIDTFRLLYVSLFACTRPT